MNGYNDIHTEPSDDEEFAIACGYEIISEEDLYDLIALSYRDQCYPATGKPKQGKGFKFPFFSKKSSASLSSMASSGVSSMAKPMSSCSLSSQASDMSEDFSSRASSGVPESLGEYDDEVDGHQLSVENLWYIIQQKRHNHHHDHDFEGEVGMAHHHLMTMEHHAPNKKLTEWLSNLLHFPEKLKQIAADKHRFNINKVSKEVRDELKHIYVY